MSCIIENLESRTLFSVKLVAGVLTITGTPGRDAFAVDQTASSIVVADGIRNTKKSFPLAKVKTIHMFGREGDDVLLQTDRVTRPGKLNGGPGNDLLQGGRGRNQFIGGGGTDGVSYATRTENLTLTLDGKGNDGRAGENDNIGNDITIVIGGKGHDRIVGRNQIQGFFGGPGNDTLIGGAKEDVLVGNAGNDVLIGNAGNDMLMGNEGDDILDGGAGVDTLMGHAGRDTIRSRDNVRDMIDGGLDPTIYDRDEVLDVLPTAPRRGVKM